MEEQKKIQVQFDACQFILSMIIDYMPTETRQKLIAGLQVVTKHEDSLILNAATEIGRDTAKIRYTFFNRVLYLIGSHDVE